MSVTQASTNAKLLQPREQLSQVSTSASSGCALRTSAASKTVYSNGKTRYVLERLSVKECTYVKRGSGAEGYQYFASLLLVDIQCSPSVHLSTVLSNLLHTAANLCVGGTFSVPVKRLRRWLIRTLLAPWLNKETTFVRRTEPKMDVDEKGALECAEQDQNANVNTAAVDAQPETLSKALHAFIIPLVCAVVGPTLNIDIEQRPSQPAAEKLIIALKEFISSIVDQGNAAPALATHGNMIEVKLEEDDGYPTNEFLIEDDEQANCDPEAVDTSEEDLPGGSISTSQSDSSGDDEGSLVDAGEEEGLVNESNHTGMSDEISGSATLERPEYTINERVLRQLRDHVFNQMPIRLLSFERRGSSLEIKLLERGDIFARLANTLLAKPEISSLSEMSSSSLESEINWLISQEAKYAILSHTWLHSTPGELTYGDWMSGRRFDIEADDDNNIDSGYQKLAKFCKVAWRDFNLAFGWMDTVCINKESSSELDESIRSMYNWYERAGVCIVYLANTENLSEMASDPWFTRGWTLQEFIAPGFLKFYNSTWKLFRNPSVNDKEYPGHPKMMAQIKKATTLFEGELFDIWSTPFSRRMQLAARREVTREEDTAYSLMGIFNVSIATAYGEGAKRAFFRLLQEILNSNAHGVLDLFNWAGDDNSTISKILPASPKQYLHSASSLDMYDIQPRTPLTLTHLGIRIPVVLVPGISVDGADDVAFKPVGSYGAIATVSSTSQGISDVYRLLDSRVSGANTYSVDEDHPEQHRCTFAVFNISDGAKGIFIPQRCIAIPIQCVEEVGKVTDLGHVERVQTDRAIVFEMLERNTGQMDVSAKDYMVPAYEGIDLAPEELPKHGMQLVFKYL